ncbi:MAG: WbqC family protein [Flavobacteriaceae bacterium]
MDTVLAPLAYGGSLTLWAYLAQAKNVVLEKHDHYQKQTQRNRQYIHGANGKLLLSIPIKHLGKEGHQHYKSVAIDNSFPWQAQHWKSLQTAYRSSPYFEFYEDAIYPLYQKNFTSLYEFNISLFEVLKRLIGIETPFLFSEKYNPHSQHLDVRSVLEVKKQSEVAAVAYTQVFEEKNGFISNLSVLDLLFNVGPESLGLLKNCTLPKKV